MPFSVVAEFILKQLVEVLIYVIGYRTGRVIVPILTAGAYRVERISFKKCLDEARHGIRREPKQPRVIGVDAAVAIGFVWWVLVVVLVVKVGMLFGA